MTRAAFDAMAAAARALTLSNAALAKFAPFPDAFRWSGRSGAGIDAAAQVARWLADGEGPEADLHRAVAAAAPHASWLHTYTEAEVGAHFLENYGYFELFGPVGHYDAGGYRAYVVYWNAGLVYDWHCHEAEELYVVLSGRAIFRSEGEPDVELTRGGTRFHASLQPHALETTDSPLLAYIVWRGGGLGDLPRMGRA